ncbi:tripartite tricarboxylate transporter substrate binding protein [Maioricimonas rarisocia]|nr:tripartite tricarboxylate transporter substrate binding protein [Maioricimonas rarisocia]
MSSVLLLAGLLLAGCEYDDLPESAGEWPRKPVKVIVPFGAGGGSDSFARIVQRAVREQNLLTEPLVIINVPGAGATIGSRRVKNARPDGYTLLMLHEAILTAKYSGNVSYGPEAFEPIAGMGGDHLVFAVADDVPFANLDDLVTAATEEPDSIAFAANLGAPSQFAGMLLEKTTPAAAFRFVQIGGGAKRFHALVGGHADVSAFSVAEYLQFRDGGLRALAVCTAEPHPELPDVPTARAQGYDVISGNLFFWWAPKGTPEDRIERIRTMLRQVMQSESVRDQLARMQIEPTFLEGEELAADLAEREARIASVAERQFVDLPDVPRAVLIVTGLFGLLVVVQAIRDKRRGAHALPKRDPPPRSAGTTSRSPARLVLLCSIATLIYVGLLQWGLIGFVRTTFVYVVVVALLLSPQPRNSLVPAGLLAGLLSVGLHALFTQVLVLDLP